MFSDAEGVITKIQETGGYGFIRVDGIDKDIFFHARDLRRCTFEQVRKNDKVKINQIEETEKGLVAKDVFLIQ